MTSLSAAPQESLPIRPDNCPRVYWHPGTPASPRRDHGRTRLEATSEDVSRVARAPGRAMGSAGYRDLLDNTHERFNQEIRRLAVTMRTSSTVSIDSRRDPVTGEAWLHGRFTLSCTAAASAPVSDLDREQAVTSAS